MNNDLRQILNALEISINSFKDYDIETLKKHYKILVRKYHPDTAKNPLELEFNTKKMSIINNCMNKLKTMIASGDVILSKESSINQNHTSNIIELINRIDILKSMVALKQSTITDLELRKDIADSLEFLDQIKERIMISIERGELYDFWDFLNYIELLDYYYTKVIEINTGYKFDYNSSNYKFNNSYLIEENSKLCLIHKQLLYKKINELINLFHDLKKGSINYKEYALKRSFVYNSIEEIDEKTSNIKWYMRLNNLDKNKLKERIFDLTR